MRAGPVLLLALAAQLAGCTLYHAIRPDVAQQVDTWRQENEYGRALETIAAVRPAHPDYVQLQARVPEIEREAEAFEDATIDEGRALIKENRWQEALARYDRGIEKLAGSERLSKARADCLARRDRYVQGLRTQALLRRGEWLVREAPLQEEIFGANPDDAQARRDMDLVTREVDATSHGLYRCGEGALARGVPDLAVNCLALAQRLKPSASTESALARAKQQQTERNQALRLKAQRKLKQKQALKVQGLLSAYELAFSGGDLLQARKALAELQAAQPGSDTVEALEAQFQAAVAERVGRGMEESRRLYSQGKIQQALDNWTALSRLDPENGELIANIARAEKVLAKLRELNEKQPNPRLPGQSSGP